METILNMVIDPDNVRMVLMVVLGWSGFVLINSKMARMEFSLNRKIDDLRHNDLAAMGKRIDGVEAYLGGQIDELRHNDLAAIHKRIDGVEASLGKQIYDLKHNDFAHLNATVVALTYALEKNKVLTREDKEYVDGRLA